jgi:hypothetical protein
MGKDPDPPIRKPPAREAGLAAALRANLRRRKRAASETAKTPPRPDDRDS